MVHISTGSVHIEKVVHDGGCHPRLGAHGARVHAYETPRHQEQPDFRRHAYPSAIQVRTNPPHDGAHHSMPRPRPHSNQDYVLAPAVQNVVQLCTCRTPRTRRRPCLVLHRSNKHLSGSNAANRSNAQSLNSNAPSLNSNAQTLRSNAQSLRSHGKTLRSNGKSLRSNGKTLMEKLSGAMAKVSGPINGKNLRSNSQSLRSSGQKSQEQWRTSQEQRRKSQEE